jgi:hypothetical protein
MQAGSLRRYLANIFGARNKIDSVALKNLAWPIRRAAL